MPRYNHKLTMYNNNVYHFNEVVDTISFVLAMHSMAAEQCAVLAHGTGKAVILEDSKKRCTRIQQELNEILPDLRVEIGKIN